MKPDNKFQVVVIVLTDGTRAIYTGRVQIDPRALEADPSLVKDVQIHMPDTMEGTMTWQSVADIGDAVARASQAMPEEKPS